MRSLALARDDAQSREIEVRLVEIAAELGIPAIALFPNTPPALRSADAREAVLAYLKGEIPAGPGPSTR